MKYEIVYDTSADRHSTERLVVTVEAWFLPEKIARIQAAGRIVVSVRQKN